MHLRLSPEQRIRHYHIIGASGTGKSALLFKLIKNDMEKGEGVAVLDPHGNLTDRILGVIPASRINDVVLVDPSDSEYSVGFNVLSAYKQTRGHQNRHIMRLAVCNTQAVCSVVSRAGSCPNSGRN
jgi:DNA helicase HerA-like ATPase